MELRTREDIRKYVAEVATRNAAASVPRLERWKRLRLMSLFTLLCFAGLQYYFLTVGVEVLSMPRLTVFLPAVRGRRGAAA